MIVYIKGCFAENFRFFCIIFNYAALIKYLFNYTEYNYNKMCNYISTKEDGVFIWPLNSYIST